MSMSLIWNLLYFSLTFAVNIILIIPVMSVVYSLNPYPELDLWAEKFLMAVGIVPTPDAIFLTLVMALLILTCAIWVALQYCPIGRFLNELVMHLTPPTEKEQEKLDLAISLIEQRSGVPKDSYRYYVCHIPDWNAVAFGGREIAVTSLMLRDFSAPTLAGMIAHEMGHHKHGDVKILAVQMGINFISWICCRLLNVLMFILNLARFIPFIGLFCALLSLVIYVLLIAYKWLITFPAHFVNLFFERHIEYGADSYAVKIGWGKELADGLRMIYEVEGNVQWWRAFASTHPRTKSRIRTIEKLLEKKAREEELGYQPVFAAPNMKAVNAAALINDMSKNGK